MNRKRQINGITEQATRFGKHDLERLGIFVEMSYMHGKGSRPPKKKPEKARNMLCPRYYSKNGTQHGYFEPTYPRLFEGEAIKRPAKRKNEAKEGMQKPEFIPAGSTKWHSCPGDHFGTFAGIVKTFSVSGAEPSQLRKEKRKSDKQKEKPKRPMVTNPGKKGGPGYPDICFSKFPEYTYNNIVSVYGAKFKYKQYGSNRGAPIKTAHCPQPYFTSNPYLEDKPKKGQLYIAPKERPHAVIGTGKWLPVGPTKWQGGCHAGMFSPFPEYKSNRSKRKEDKEREARMKKAKEQDSGVKFGPQSMALKKMFTSSVLNQNTDLCVNGMNYKRYEPTYTKYLL